MATLGRGLGEGGREGMKWYKMAKKNVYGARGRFGMHSKWFYVSMGHVLCIYATNVAHFIFGKPMNSANAHILTQLILKTSVYVCIVS